MDAVKSYIYANSQILSQHDYSDSNDYYYLHDRLGSVRQIIDSNRKVEKYYYYTPFGQLSAEDSSADAPSNPWQFTGQYFDDETGQYYLRARQYSPYISRFTGRDLIVGDFNEPLTLHKYLYCFNNPVNMIDPIGLDAYLFFDPSGGPGLWDGSEEVGHVDIGVDAMEYPQTGAIITRTASWGHLDPITRFKNFEQASSYGNKFVIRFKNRKLKDGSDSDGMIWSYLQGGLKPFGIPYCSTYAKDALKLGGYDMGLGSGITPKMLLYSVLEKYFFDNDDKNIEIDINQLYYLMRDGKL